MEQALQKPKKEKKIYFELMRILAILFVIFSHTGSDGYFLFASHEPTNIFFWSEMLVSVFCRFPPLIFFMISGALLLGKEEDLKTLWKKRISRMLVVLLFFSFGFYLWDVFFYNTPFSLLGFLRRLYTNGVKTPMWYLYAYLGFLLSLPFLRSMVKGMQKVHYRFLLGIALVLEFLPILEQLLLPVGVSLNGYVKPTWLLTNIVLYPVMGYYLEHVVDFEKVKKRLPLFLIADLLTMLISVIMTWRFCAVDGHYTESASQGYMTSFVLINTATVFLTVKALSEKIRFGERTKKLIFSMGECTFGIYLFHIWVLITPGTSGTNVIPEGLNLPFLAVWLYILCVFLLSYAITFLVKKIPGVKKYI